MEYLLKTPLYNIYKDYGAKVIDFAGWALPVQFSGIIEEHQTVRTRVGVFDVSHMGEILISGKGSTEYLDYLLANEIAALKNGGVRYAHICNYNGGVIDDILVYRFDNEEYMLVVNAANIDKDLGWIRFHHQHNVNVKDISRATGQLAIQGPCSEAVLKKLASIDMDKMRYYSFEKNVVINGHKCVLSRTGYTGEDGFEIYCSHDNAAALWESIMEAGEEYGICPVGLGARDTLRLEACMPLYGHELSDDISPLEAGLGNYVKLDKGDFIGKSGLVDQEQHGVQRKLFGLEMVERGIPRNGYPVLVEGQKIGTVTSGSYCPTLQKNLALAILQTKLSTQDSALRTNIFIGQGVEVEIRGKAVKAKVVEIPFYRRQLL